MPQFLIGGIHVEFPKTPYPCQIQYMEHVIRALSSGSNALLESPTGTGKTLCLLCATLAWQESRKPKSIDLAYSSGKSIDAGPGGIKTSVMPGEKKSAPYTIVYATRTHSQLAQVVSELRETAYRPRMTVLGSREQLCVHEKVSKLKNGVINHACNSLNSKRGCMYRNNLDNYIESNSSMDNTGMMDIEEMVKLGNHRKICPYFHSREFCASSDIVLLPYNYLLDGNIRSSVKVDWTNAIIIFDEAHNLERVSADAASFSLSSTDLALCIQEMQQVLGTLRDEQQRTKAPSEADAQAKLVVPANPAAAGSGQDKPSLASVVTLLKAMFELEKRIDALQILPHVAQQQTLPGIVYEGQWLPDLLKAVGFTDVMHVVELKKCCNMLMEMAQDALGFDAVGASAAAVEPKLQAFTSSMARVLNSVKSRSSMDYKVYIADEVIKQASGTYAAEGRAVQKKRVINYWCFSTGVAMQELQNLGVKSLLLTSGTLSPMGALKEDIKLPFPIQLENPHVIGDNQMWVAALPTGVSGKALNSSFQSRDTSAYKDELGLSVLQICNTMAGGPSPSASKPPVNAGWAAYGVTAVATAPAAPAPRVRGGVLIFFPSYAVMENVAARWKETGVHDKLRNSVGAVLMEPKGAGISNAGGAAGPSTAAKRSNGGFHSGRDHHPAVEGNFMLNGGVTRKPKVLDDEDGEGGEEFRTIVGQFEHAIKVNGGCVLLAVCRGKVSEGIDFTDNKGRVVIITGIPFAPYMDPWVVLKKQYLDDKSSGKLVAPPPLVGPVSAPDTGPVLNLAAFQRPVTASAYPVVMGPPVLLSATTAQAQAFGGVPPAAFPPAAPSGYGPHGSGLVSGYGAPSAAVKKAAPSQSLNGQGWYSQTAGRAVNQCIGRVIRHNKDWGTVFLLDDRFMNDRQIAQLSGWVKPRVKKFTSFEAALKGFRAFITVAAQDKTLVSQSMAQRAAEPAPDIERFRRREASEKPKEATFTRQIEIHESELSGAGEDNTFINPSFLLTQSSSVRSTREEPVAERDSEKAMLSLFRKSGGSSSSSQSTSAAVSQPSEAGKGSLLDAFSRSREKSSTVALPSAAAAAAAAEPLLTAQMENYFDKPLAPPLTISFSSASANNGAAASAKPATASFGLAAASKPASFFVPEKIVRTKDSTIADYFAPPKPAPVPASQAQAQAAAAQKLQTQSQATPKPQSTIARPPAVVKKSGLEIPKFSQSSSVRDAPPSTQSSQPSFLKYLSKLDDDINDAPDPVTEFHNQIAVLKGLLSKDKLLALKSKLMLAKGSVVSTIAHLRHFLAAVMTILDGVDANVKLRALRSFVCMLPSGLSEDYLELVSEAVQDSKSSSSFGSKQSLSKPWSAGGGDGARDVSLSERAKNESVVDSKRKAEEDRLYSQSQSQSAFLTQDVKLEGGQPRSAPSKRAKLMLSASLAARADSGLPNRTEGGAAQLQTSAAQSSVRGGSALAFLSKMSSLDSIALTGAVKASNSTESRSNRVGSANLACTVCKEQPATDPCAARCGHVCCQVCWTKWLKVNQSCPQCRQPADVNSVTRIVVKR